MCDRCSKGQPFPIGATLTDGGVNFAVYSENAKRIFLEFYNEASDSEPSMTFCLDSEYNRSGSIWHCFVKGASAGQLYLYRTEGEYAPEKGLRFDSEAHLFDPYAKAFSLFYPSRQCFLCHRHSQAYSLKLHFYSRKPEAVQVRRHRSQGFCLLE